VPTTVVTNLFGTAGSFSISSTGEVLQTITATSADGKLTITIPTGTKALDKDGKPLTSLTSVINPTPPPPPAGAHIIGLAYTFGPDGATFNPPLTLTWSYDPAALPTGVAEEALVIAYYDATAGKWVELQCVVDAANNKITASVSHFTTFAILAHARPAAFTVSALSISPAEVAIGDSVTISTVVNNTGDLSGSYEVTLKIDNVVVETKTVTLAGGATQTVTFTTTKDVAGTYTVNINGLSGTFTVKAVEVPAGIAWWVWVIVGVVVVIVVWLVYLLWWRRR
jgi:hypothetical protein